MKSNRKVLSEMRNMRYYHLEKAKEMVKDNGCVKAGNWNNSHATVILRGIAALKYCMEHNVDLKPYLEKEQENIIEMEGANK